MTDTVLILGVSPEEADAPETTVGSGRAGRFDSWGVDAIRWFDSELAAAMVGWRCTLIGPEWAVQAAQSRAIAAGAVSEELEVVVTERGIRRVYCPSCGEVTAVLLSDVHCEGCGCALTVGEHYSPVLAAHLGALC